LISGRSSHPPSREVLSGSTKRPSTVIPNSVLADLDVVYASYPNSDREHDSRHMLMDVFRPKKLDAAAPAIVVVTAVVG